MIIKGGTRRGVIGVLFLFLILSAGVFADTVTEGAISKDVEKYVESFVTKSGIEKERIKNVKEVDMGKLPDEVKIKEIGDNHVDIYEVDYSLSEQDENKLYVITYSTDKFEAINDVKNLNYFTFGYSENSEESGYLETASGVVSDEEKGYVMMRGGSITGVSTSLSLEGDGYILIKIYKNGEDTGFENKISTDDQKYIDYDLQSEDLVTFDAGDIMGVYVESYGNVTWSSVTSSVEITTY